jgi:hypothetical protein
VGIYVVASRDPLVRPLCSGEDSPCCNKAASCFPDTAPAEMQVPAPWNYSGIISTDELTAQSTSQMRTPLLKQPKGLLTAKGLLTPRLKRAKGLLTLMSDSCIQQSCTDRSSRETICMPVKRCRSMPMCGPLALAQQVQAECASTGAAHRKQRML